ncbi:MAG: pyridoxamine kinase [Clostridiales bacterium]|nr:MAG: pyridoxamine kinase [Clostridiales bacterium]
MNKQKRIVAIHDISCLGKCSLTVALPVLSAAGHEVLAVPTAVLSTHTGGFTGFTFRDLTDDLLPIMNHWQTLNLEYDAFYTGYLGSFRQIDIVCQMIEKLKTKETFVFIDPVMGDNGKLYTAFTQNFPQEMKRLCAQADMICPNITEAALLTESDYKVGPFDKLYIEGMLEKLSKLGPKKIILTGVYFDNKTLGAAYFDSGKIGYCFSDKIPGFFHGTGDVFASAFLGAYLKNNDIKKSLQIAVDFTEESIIRTKNDSNAQGYGVNFEEGLGSFAKSIG